MNNLEERLLYLEADLTCLRTEIDLVKRRLATSVQAAPPLTVYPCSDVSTWQVAPPPARCACTLPVFAGGCCSMCAGRP